MKRSRTMSIVIATSCVLAVLAGAAILAAAHGPAGPGGITSDGMNPPVPQALDSTGTAPPEEAVSACTGKSAGDTCRFADRDGILTGICDDKPGMLACASSRNRDSGNVTGTDPVPPEGNAQQGTAGAGTMQPGGVGAGSGAGSFRLTSNASADGATLPAEYTCDGSGATPALSWSGAPAGTEEFALMMTTLPGDGTTRWNWVLYGIPGTTTGLVRNSSGVGTPGTGSHGTVMQYDPPCSQGPGAKIYTFTVYALSAPPALPGTPGQVTGQVLTSAISSITLAKASFSLSYTRP